MRVAFLLARSECAPSTTASHMRSAASAPTLRRSIAPASSSAAPTTLRSRLVKAGSRARSLDPPS
eukprot:2340779-Pyramimonas_sp.AAC.1